MNEFQTQLTESRLVTEVHREILCVPPFLREPLWPY